MIDVWQYSEYALDSEYGTVLNMLGSQKVLNKIFQHKYLTGFWICLEFWKHQCYTGFCRKQPVIHVCQVSEYSLGSQSARAWTCMVLPPRWNSPCCDEGAYPPRSSNQSASTRRAQLSVTAKAVGPTDLLNQIKAWVNTDYTRLERPSLAKALLSM